MRGSSGSVAVGGVIRPVHERADHERPVLLAVSRDQLAPEQRPLVPRIVYRGFDGVLEVLVDLAALGGPRSDRRIDRALVLVEDVVGHAARTSRNAVWK